MMTEIDYMQFRVQGNTVRVFRAVTDEQTGKPRADRVGIIKRGKMVIGEKLRAACTDAELAEIQSWIDREQSLAQLKAEYAAETLSEQMALARRWFQTVEPAEGRALAEDIRAAWASLRLALNVNQGAKRRGVKKKKKIA